MQAPALAVGGSVPLVSPLMALFLVLAVAGAMMLVAALLLRNLRLMTRHRLNLFSPADMQRAADPTLSTRSAGAVPFWRSPYARIALGLLVIGLSGLAILLIVHLFFG